MLIYNSLVRSHVHHLPAAHVENVPLPYDFAHIISHRYDFQFCRGTASGLTAFTTPVLGVWAGWAGASGMGTSEKSS